jgi:thiol-disulfide isomerase/thioredoxin
MSSFVQVVYDKYLRHYLPYYFVLLLLVLFGGISYYLFLQYYLNPSVDVKYKDVPNMSDNDKRVLITMYHVDWCPYCKTALPEYESFKQKYNDQIVNGYRIRVVEMDCTDESDPQVKIVQQDVTSYPTVKALVPDTVTGRDKEVKFEARVTSTNLSRFAETITRQ